MPKFARPNCMRKTLFQARTVILCGLFVGLSVGKVSSRDRASIRVISDDIWQSNEQYETIQYQWEWLWDPTSPDLDEWQILDRPRGVASSPWGDLILADTGNSRLIRVSPEGALIEVIGRLGSGPGEFRSPREVGFSPDSDALWVIDRSNARIMRFQVGRDRSDFLDSHPIPIVGVTQNMAVLDGSTFCFSRPETGKRISQIDLSGDFLQSFGDLFESPYPVFSQNRYNSGFICVSGREEILYIGIYCPWLERWSKEGSLLTSALCPSPVAKRKPSRELPDGSMPIFGKGAVFNPQNRTVYLWTGPSPIYELSAITFDIERCFEFQNSDGFPGEIFGVLLLNGMPQFYLYDREYGGIRVLSKIE